MTYYMRRLLSNPSTLRDYSIHQKVVTEEIGLMNYG